MDIKTRVIQTIYRTPRIAVYYKTTYPNSKYSLDMIISDILHLHKTGIAWRDIRTKCSHTTLFYHYQRFQRHDIFGKVFRELRGEYIKQLGEANVWLLIDSSVINNKYGVTKIGRNKFYKNKRCTKLSLMTDQNGIPLSVLLMKGNKNDNHTFSRHIDDAIILLPKNKKKVLADKGYTSKNNYELLESKGIGHIIPPRKNMKLYKSYTYNKTEYAKRIRIENTFARLKKFRRLDCRYDKKVKSFWGFINLGCSIMIIEHMLRNYK